MTDTIDNSPDYLKQKGRFFLSCMLFAAVFLITRLPYFALYPVTTVSSDSASYIAAAFRLMDLQAPMFDIRTPGYPFFLAAVWSVSQSFLALSFVQSLITFLCGIFFIVCSFRCYPKHVLLFAVAAAAFISSSYFIVLEMSVLTEGIFSSLMLPLAGIVMLAVKTGRAAYWALFSVLVALLILIRPAGLFLVAVFAPLILYFIVTGSGSAYYRSLILPFLLIISSLCTYNYFTLGKFTITPFGEANLAGATILFMEASPEYPDFVNSAIKSTLDSIPNRDLNYVRNSYNPDRLFIAFKEHYHMQMNLVNHLKNSGNIDTYMQAQPILRQISLDAIGKNPEVYAKFFYCNFYYFLTNVGRKMDYFTELEKIYKRSVIDRRFVNELNSGRWRQVSGDEQLNLRVKELFEKEFRAQEGLSGFSLSPEGKVHLMPSWLKSFADVYQKIYELLFRNLVWLVVFLVVSGAGIWLTLRSKFRNEDAFIAMTFACVFFAKALLVSVVESSLERYSYTVELFIYMSLPMAFVLSDRIKSKKQNT